MTKIICGPSVAKQSKYSSVHLLFVTEFIYACQIITSVTKIGISFLINYSLKVALINMFTSMFDMQWFNEVLKVQQHLELLKDKS